VVKQSAVKRKKNPGILIPLILALVVAFLFYKGAERKTVTTIQPTQVPIATVRLNEHTQIKENHIAMITIPARGVPPNIVRDPKELIGKYVGTKYTIPQNGYFYRDAISNFEDIPSRIPMMLGPNELGITLRMNLERSVANSLREGQYVQVRFFTNKTPTRQPFEGVLEERIKILALRDNSGADVVGTDADRNKVPTIVVFEATDEQVSYLLRAQNLGDLNIVAISETLYRESKEEEKEKTNTPKDDKEDALVELLNTINKYITKEQRGLLEELRDEYVDGKGSRFAGNEVKLFIDSMTYRIEQLFAQGEVLATPAGEIVYYDHETGQIRYFSDQREYEGSVYALRKFTPEEMDALERAGRLTEAQRKALQQQRLANQEPKFFATPGGEVFEMVDGRAVFYSVAEAIKRLEALKETTGRLSVDNQLLLDRLKSSPNSNINTKATFLVTPKGEVYYQTPTGQVVFLDDKAALIALTEAERTGSLSPEGRKVLERLRGR
jgi:Flp pilus assembly protein CpaB